MIITQELRKFFDANPGYRKESKALYSAYKVKCYTYNQTKNQHKLTVVAKDPNGRNQNNYQLEKIGDLHHDLIDCLQKREEIVYFWSGDKLVSSDSFCFEGGGYHWTIIPKKYLTEKQNAQAYIDKNYPREQRKNLEKLSIIGIKDVGWQLLAGKLDLSDFVNLKELYCSDNRLTSLNLSNCSQLEKLDCSNNKLTDANSLFSGLNSDKLQEVDISNNKFAGDLKLFSRFINLESLAISNNNFTGSLQPLQNLTKLKELNITNTNINNGLQCLPNNLEKFQCYDPDYEQVSFKSTEFYKQELRGFNGNLKTWKEFFNSSAREWLDKEYPESEENLEEDDGEISSIPNWFAEEKNTNKERKDNDNLDINNKNLEGPLKLKGFTNLEKLNCANNKLTSLNLSDCPDLIELNISNNEFSDLEFLKQVPKLEVLLVANNRKFPPPRFKYFTLAQKFKRVRH